MSKMGSFLSSASSGVLTLEGDIGGPVSPLAGNIEILGSSGIETTSVPFANLILVKSTGGGLPWEEIIALTKDLSIDHGYILNNAAPVVCTLPVASSVGDVISIIGKGSGGWKIEQNAGQTIHFSVSDTTVGVAGYLESTSRYDCVELVCITDNNEFLVKSSIGNVTVN